MKNGITNSMKKLKTKNLSGIGLKFSNFQRQKKILLDFVRD